jgi:uncharacterized protein YkwD
MNGDNGFMKRATIATVAAASLLLAACGGGGNKNVAPVQKQKQPGGGVVQAQPTTGLLGPATTVTPQGAKTVGRTGPISPNENRPTDAQSHGVAGGVACQSTSLNPAPSNINSLAGSILCLLNAERAAKGLPPLHANGSLAKAARAWAGRMVAAKFFAHESGSSTPLSRIKRTGYVRGSWQIGENIAWGSGALATPRSIVNGWMHSPGHRANILHGSFKDIGIGIKIGAPGAGLSGGAVYVTDFGKHS